MASGFFNIFKIYFRFFFQRTGPQFFIVLGLTSLAAFFDSFGVLLFLPILENNQKDSSDFISSSHENDIEIIDYFISIFSFFGLEFNTLNILLFMCVAFIIKSLFTFLSHRYSAILRSMLILTLKFDLIEKIQRLDYVYFVGKDSGTFANLVNEQVSKVIITFTHFVNTTTHFITAIFYIGSAFFVSPTFGIAASILGVGIIFVFRRLSNLVRSMSVDSSDVTSELTQLTIEMASNFKYLKSTRSFDKVNEKIKILVIKLKNYHFITGVAEALTMSVREPFLAIILALILFVQLNVLAVDLSVTLIAMLLFYRGMNSIFNAQRSWQNTLEFSGSIDFLIRNLNDFKYDYKTSVGTQRINARWSKIVFENVSFGYHKKNSKQVLSEINLHIPRNKFVVILGRSGSGKTTLIDLIIGLIKPTNGSIFMEDCDGNRSFDFSKLDSIGYVSQDTVAFTDTMENNITLWNSQKLTSDLMHDRLKKVTQMAGLDGFISKLPDGLQTQMGDRGMQLSGGQKQRVFLARELFKRPDILILDESTSALDITTEQEVLDKLNNLKGKMTIIFVTHREKILELADHIIDLNQHE